VIAKATRIHSIRYTPNTTRLFLFFMVKAKEERMG
jgi:hypothetical protein